MKYTSAILVSILLITAGCGGNKQPVDDFITVDITKKPSSHKELILQDFMDVEYIALETKDDFINQGFVQAVGDKYILVKNRNSDGDIFVYDRTGKALRKINRKGQGGEEYTHILGITLDEDREEMLINDHFLRKILVYDLKGNYKRSISYKDNTEFFYTDIFNYDRDNLLCYDQYNEKKSFVFISKQDGSITKEIKIPFEKKKLLMQKREEGEMIHSVTPGPHRSIIPNRGNWYLLELSSDTIYNLLPNYTLQPFLVRTPPIQSMDPEDFLLVRLLSDRYCFMETIKNVFDFDAKTGFSKAFMMYDRQERELCNYTVHNGDYTYKQEIYMNMSSPVGHDIESWYPLEASPLIKSYKRGELKGKLKEAVATLDEEDNPVIMLIKHKK